MGKRAAVVSAKAVKVARSVKLVERVAPADPFSEECSLVLDFLANAEVEGSAECRLMLCAAAPFAFGRSPDERHAYQNSVVDTIGKLITEARGRHVARVEAARAGVRKLEAEEAAANADLEKIQEAVADKRQQAEAKEDMYKLATEAVSSAANALEGARAAAESVAESVKRNTQLRADLEIARATIWNPLKEFAFSKQHEDSTVSAAQLRATRDKHIARAQQLLAQAGASASLAAAMAAAFKTKPEARGAFTASAIQHAEAALDAYAETLLAAVGAADSETANAAQAVQAADAAAIAARATQEEVYGAMAEAQNQLAAEQSVEHDERHENRRFKSLYQEFGTTLKVAELEQDHCVKVLARFDVLKLGTPDKFVSEADSERNSDVQEPPETCREAMEADVAVDPPMESAVVTC